MHNWVLNVCQCHTIFNLLIVILNILLNDAIKTLQKPIVSTSALWLKWEKNAFGAQKNKRIKNNHHNVYYIIKLKWRHSKNSEVIRKCMLAMFKHGKVMCLPLSITEQFKRISDRVHLGCQRNKINASSRNKCCIGIYSIHKFPTIGIIFFTINQKYQHILLTEKYTQNPMRRCFDARYFST